MLQTAPVITSLKYIQTENFTEKKVVLGIKIAPSGLEIKLYSKRYVYLLIVSLGSLLSTVTYSQYAIVADVLTEYYGISYITLEWTSLIVLVGFVLPVYPTIILFQKKGLKTVFVVGLVGISLGMWIQGVGSHTGLFWLILLGQCFVSSVQCCFVNLTPQFVSYWFNTDEVSTACAVVIFFNSLGTALSCVIPPTLIKRYSYLSTGIKLTYLNYAMAIVTTLLTILTIFVFEEKPAQPPSIAQAKIWRKEARKGEKSASVKLWSETKELMKNKNFLVHIISASIAYSFSLYYLIIFDQLLIVKYPGMENDIGILGLINNLMGIPGTMLFGFIVDKTHKYKETVFTLNVCIFLSVCFYAGSIYVNMITIYVSSSVLGFFMGGYLNVSLEMASEISYPVSEAVSSSVFLCFGSLLGIVMTYVSNWLLANFDYVVPLVAMIIYSFLAMLFSSKVKTNKV